MPTAEVESAFYEPIMQWRSSVNSTVSSPYYGMFAQGLALAGEQIPQAHISPDSLMIMLYEYCTALYIGNTRQHIRMHAGQVFSVQTG